MRNLRNPNGWATTLVGAVVAMAVGCGTTGTPEDEHTGDYIGTASTVVTIMDEFGGILSQQTYSTNVRVHIGAPQENGGTTESNPITLWMTAESPTAIGANGTLDITSAAGAINQQDGQDHLLQYWTLEQNDTALTGTLNNTHVAEGSELNLLWSTDAAATGQPQSFPLDTGATLDGTVTETEFRVRIEGTVTDGSRRFVSDVVATR